MTKKIESLATPNRRNRSLWLAFMTGVFLGVTAVSGVAQAQAQAPATGATAAQSVDDLGNLVGPIALYPDDLVAIILPASTNPLQIVQADRFLDKRKTDPKAPLDDRWDDSVKSLLNYPDIVKKMSGDLDWTSALGEAVVADQGAVLDAIQSYRRKAQAAGNLKSDGKQVVQSEQQIITIVPANPEVIYVPQYNPTTVLVAGYPGWGYYPTPYPSYYYPYAPGAALAAGVFWGAAIGAAWNGGHWGANYGGNANININRNTNINTGNINRGGGASTRPAGGGTAWKSNKQPGQVSSSVGKTNSSARPGDRGVGGAGSMGGGGGIGGNAGARPSTQPGAVVVPAAAALGVAAVVVVDGRSRVMKPSLSFQSKASAMNITHFWSILRRLALALMLVAPLAATAAPQETFATPQAAVDALMAALKADSDAAMIALFGEAHKDLVIQSDRAASSANRAKVLAAMQAYRVLAEPSPDRRVLVIGDQAWPAPIPLVHVGDRWRFATELGADELVNRRIGGNEYNAIHVLRAFVDAQRAFAAVDRDGDGVLQFAQKLASTPGKRDGLYWTADPAKGEEMSPFGPLIAESSAYFKGHTAGDPYRGYHFRILTRQGEHAPGGAYNYVINGRMIAGFAMVAFPAEWDKTGVMSFIVNHNGKVYQKDLGKNSTAIGARMTSFDPGPGWKEVAP